MSSASSSNAVGASDHKAKNEWNGAFSFSNIGLPGAAFEKAKWKKHELKLREIFSNLLMAKQRPQGILLCEVGNRSDPVTLGERKLLEDALEVAFEETGASEHGREGAS